MSLQIQSLSIHHKNESSLIKNVDLVINQGEVLTLMGPSGCGKSTLLSAIAGHLANDFWLEGSILLDGQPIQSAQPHLRQVGILFQDDLLFPHLNIWENIAIALPNEIKGQKRKERALECLQQVKLDHLAFSMPNQVSGGQRARISLLRMLQANPKVVLLDEPFSKLDKDLRETFRAWVFDQLKQAQIPALMVTHDEDDIPSDGKLIYWENLKKEMLNA
ncbi:ATP-binding cassette domain-containing protein [Vibrio rumoiensis]|uniref:ABC transporter ATP-binding protein n=1 Tax=Vibrio rumoiensis 1S-45 TaxID=1188252 RepID=A0A1E5E1Y1_9VIBR|nr:ATP-binding cassette domain-containing protein [Vibrio rumoiensis]OEF25371.1 ABC transporter ATP-binding protein [Vibrio rumoiensis 1S-45]